MSGRRDRWLRVTPYEIGIPGRAFADRVFPAIDEEARTRGVDPADPGAFFQLGEVGRAIREIQGEERGREAIERFGAFLFHAWHFHRHGETTYLLGTEAARELVEEGGAPPPPWDGRLPAPAGYVQLPRHLFWSHPEGEGVAEPIDGFFWTRGTEDTLALLVALGVRGDRPGLSVVELPPLPLTEALRWVAGGSREGGDDFATTLPGGELDRLYSIVTLGEVLTLTGRLFATLLAHPGRVGAEEHSPRPEEAESEGGGVGVQPSFLPFRRLAPATPEAGAGEGAPEERSQ